MDNDSSAGIVTKPQLTVVACNSGDSKMPSVSMHAPFGFFPLTQVPGTLGRNARELGGPVK